MTASPIEGDVPCAADMPRYVRFQRQRPDGYVEFVFSIDDPELGVELILPRSAFDEFCALNHVSFITDDQAAALDHEAQKWRYGIPGLFE